MRKVMLFCLLVLLSLSFVAADGPVVIQSAGCTDTDGPGFDPSTLGSASDVTDMGQPTTGADVCASNGDAEEYGCIGNNFAQLTYQCRPASCGTDGRCAFYSRTDLGCFDADAGDLDIFIPNERFTRSQSMQSYGMGIPPSESIQEDYCNGNELKEYGCQDGGEWALFKSSQIGPSDGASRTVTCNKCEEERCVACYEETASYESGGDVYTYNQVYFQSSDTNRETYDRVCLDGNGLTTYTCTNNFDQYFFTDVNRPVFDASTEVAEDPLDYIPCANGCSIGADECAGEVPPTGDDTFDLDACLAAEDAAWFPVFTDADGDGYSEFEGDNDDCDPAVNPECSNPLGCSDIDTDLDPDGDGLITFFEDNCGEVYNPGQEDFDGDTVGDACDDDIDGDGFSNDEETEAGSDHLSPDSTPSDIDGDGTLNEADNDIDGDGFSNDEEIAAGSDPTDAADTPGAPDPNGDNDGDGILNIDDNCDYTYNSQTDADQDDVGDACDYCPNTPVSADSVDELGCAEGQSVTGIDANEGEDTCVSLGGINCGSDSCSGLQTETWDSSNCCLSDGLLEPLCTTSYFNPNLGQVFQVTYTDCVDPDGDGVGERTISGEEGSGSTRSEVCTTMPARVPALGGVALVLAICLVGVYYSRRRYS